MEKPTINDLLENILLIPEPLEKKLTNLRMLRTAINSIGIQELLNSVTIKTNKQ